LFAAEFFFLYTGLSFTSASRSVVLQYTAPLFTMGGAHLFIPNEKLGPSRVLGTICAFGGLLVVFSGAFGISEEGRRVGDILVLLSAILWAATTVTIKATVLMHVSPHKVLFYQLATSAILLPLVSMCLGDGVPPHWSLISILCLVYETVGVAFVSYLVWFWMVHRYPAATLSNFTLLTPLFGVVFGDVLLGDPVSLRQWVALLLVVLGLFLANRPQQRILKPVGERVLHDP